jgi:septum formation protein
MSRLLLASTSRYRRALLQRLRLPFEVAAPAVDEAQEAGESVESMVARLALAKARAVARQHPDAWVIGADQAASLGGRALGKPGERDRAIEQLGRCAGQAVHFFTAVSLAGPGGQESGHLDETVVHFRALAGDEIVRYVDAESPLDCAGSFKCEGLGITLFDAIRSEDPTALVGLPLIGLARLLREAGIALP